MNFQTLNNPFRLPVVGLFALILFALGLFASPSYAQIDDDGVLDYSDILAAGV